MQITQKEALTGVRHVAVHTLSKCHTLSRPGCKRNSTYVPTKSKAHPAPIFTNLVNPQQQYAQISGPKLDRNRTENAESAGTNSRLFVDFL